MHIIQIHRHPSIWNEQLILELPFGKWQRESRRRDSWHSFRSKKYKKVKYFWKDYNTTKYTSLLFRSHSWTKSRKAKLMSLNWVSTWTNQSVSAIGFKISPVFKTIWICNWKKRKIKSWNIKKWFGKRLRNSSRAMTRKDCSKRFCQTTPGNCTIKFRRPENYSISKSSMDYRR